jgi:hypothetical protein
MKRFNKLKVWKKTKGKAIPKTGLWKSYSDTPGL